MAKTIDIDIQKGGIGDKVGEKLSSTAFDNRQKESEKTSNLSDNVSQKLADSEIAGIASAALQYTDAEYLKQKAQNLQNYSQMLADMGLQSPDMLVDIVMQELTNLLGNTGVLDAIETGINTATGTVDLAKKGLQIAQSGASVAANIAEMATKTVGVMNADYTMVPSVKDSTLILGASLKEIIMGKYNDAKIQIVNLYNSLICTGNESNVDNAIQSINNILSTVEPFIDPTMAQYTGHTLSEVRYMCNNGLQMIEMLKRVSNENRKAKQDQSSDQPKTNEG